MKICTLNPHERLAPDPPSRPAVTPDEAHADRTARAKQHAQNCVLMAVVTTPPIAAELIDQAIVYVRSADIT